jgi:Uncharacterized protein conserved in bacteria (DUF2252)
MGHAQPDAIAATRKYDRWLARQTNVVASDVAFKHQQMDKDPFVFLRATYYLWIRQWASALPKLAKAPRVASIGDLHMENFGTWRDAEGRLVWGINDFDEAHSAPYTNDLIRLATSVLLAVRAGQLRLSASRAINEIAAGYEETLRRGGRPIVLAEHNRWLRTIALSQLKDPAKFWDKLLAGAICAGDDYPVSVVRRTLPRRNLEYVVHRRRAGVGSLGRPRFVVLTTVGGGYLARELKAAVRRNRNSAWLVKHAVRVHDPFYKVTDAWVTRRLAPDCTKLNLQELAAPRDQSRLFHAMGAETANVHVASDVDAIVADLEKRPEGWLDDAAAEMADVVVTSWKAWKRR